MRTELNFFFILFGLFMGWSQKGEITNHIYEGNEKTETQAYTEAEKSYRKALSLAPEQAAALYNLGTTHFLDKQYEEASQRFFQTQKFAATKPEKHRAFHNMGNAYMKQKEYQKAVEAYKNALRNNPADEETRYNYALAKSLLDNEEPPQEQEQEDKKDKKEQEEQQDKEQNKDQQGDQENEDEQNPEKEGDQGDESKEDGKPKNEGDQNKEQKQKPNESQPKDKRQAPKKGQLSPEQVQSLLEAMNNQEKKVQDKVNAKKVKGVPVRGKKDW